MLKYTVFSFETHWIKQRLNHGESRDILKLFADTFIDREVCSKRTTVILESLKDCTDYLRLKEAIFSICLIEDMDLNCLTLIQKPNTPIAEKRGVFRDAKRNNYRNLAGS